MGESKRRKNVDPNYGKSKVKIIKKDTAYYISTSNIEFVLYTIKEWRQIIKNSPAILLETHKKYLSSKFARTNRITANKLPIKTYAELILNTYDDFTRYITEKQADYLDIRLLKDREDGVYSITAIQKSKCIQNSPSLVLNEPMPWIEFLIVNPLLLNQGVGKLTFQYVIAELGSRIASQIYVDSAGFFEKQGFKLEVYLPNNDADFYLAQNLSSNLNIDKKELLNPDEYGLDRIVEIVHSSSISSEEVIKFIEMEYPDLSISTLRSIEHKGIYKDRIESTNILTSIHIDSCQNTKEDSPKPNFSCNSEPDYEALIELYLSKGLTPLQSAILDWLDGNNYIVKNSSDRLTCLNQISMTVLDIASKNAKVLASHDLRIATFALKVPFELQDYYSYQPVQSQRELAKEAMTLINTCFFDKAITELINIETDSIKTLRQNGIVLYMGVNDSLEIFDAACALVAWKPFHVVQYVGEQRNNLNRLIEKTFEPLASSIQDFRIKQKRADKFPCLTLLCLVESKTTGRVSEFRRHFTAQSGGQLIIPGFSDGSDGVIVVSTPMNVIGNPKKIPSIRGFLT